MLTLFSCIGKFNYHKLQVMETKNRNKKGIKQMLNGIKNHLEDNWIYYAFALMLVSFQYMGIIDMFNTDMILSKLGIN